MDERTYEELKFSVQLEGSRAAWMLKHLLRAGNIPAAHVSHVQEIVDDFDAAEKAWKARHPIARVAA